MQTKNAFNLTLVCHNCTHVAVYSFPLRRRFYGYRPDYFDSEGTIVDPQVWSKIGPPTNEARAEIVTCTNCAVPMLTGAPYQLTSPTTLQTTPGDVQ